MGSKERRPRTTPAGRFVRGRRFDRNPLRRPADRAETIVLALLLVAFLIGAPLAALASGSWAACDRAAGRARPGGVPAPGYGCRPHGCRAGDSWIMEPDCGHVGPVDRAGWHGGDERTARPRLHQGRRDGSRVDDPRRAAHLDAHGRVAGGVPRGPRRDSRGGAPSRCCSPSSECWPVGRSTSAGWPRGRPTGSRPDRAGRPVRSSRTTASGPAVRRARVKRPGADDLTKAPQREKEYDDVIQRV